MERGGLGRSLASILSGTRDIRGEDGREAPSLRMGGLVPAYEALRRLVDARHLRDAFVVVDDPVIGRQLLVAGRSVRARPACRDRGLARLRSAGTLLSRLGAEPALQGRARLLAPDRVVVRSVPCNVSHVSARAVTPRSREVQLMRARLGTAIGPGRMAVMCTDGMEGTGRS
jgi:hypothetical protein